jgi:sugar phosphate isomerase/epimerase
MMRTRTGGFRVGFRRGWSDWQKDLSGLAVWGKDAGFELIDLGQAAVSDLTTVRSAGLEVISVDMLDWSALLSPDGGRRRDAIARNTAYLKDLTPLGVKVFFAVAIPEDPGRPGRENFDLAVASYGELAPLAESMGAAIALEGWPGGPPFPNLCCNPETCRAMFKEVASPGLGLNFDPSHLIRMGIDHARFIDEFAGRVAHVHGKDTEIITENLYDVGLYQQSVFQKPFFCGEFAWRYCIPGHGVARWTHIFSTLEKAGFRGAVSVELEDASYNGTEQGEKAGLLTALQYLQTV